jgi:hypothetical protein
MRSALLLLMTFASIAWAAGDPDLQTVPATVGPELVVGTAAFERPAMASNGSGLLLAWDAPEATGVNHLNVQRAGANGTLLGTRTPVGVTANAQRDPLLTADGTNYLLVWYDYTSAAAALRGSIINGATGAPSAAFTISSNVYVQPLGSVEGIRVDRAVAAWSGSVYRIFWIDGSVPGGQAMGAVVTPQGLLQSKFTIGDFTHLDDALSGASRTLVIGTATVSGRLTLYSQAIEADNVPGPQMAIASEFQAMPSAMTSYLTPVIASSTSSTLAGWIVSRPGSADHIEATRLDPAGTPLDVHSEALGVRGFVIEPNPYSMRYNAVLNLLPDGAGFTLVWMRWGAGTFSGIWTLRLDANGRAISVRYPLALRSPLLFDDPQFPSATVLPNGSLAVAYIRNGAKTQLYLRVAPRQALAKRRGVLR